MKLCEADGKPRSQPGRLVLTEYCPTEIGYMKNSDLSAP